jgi:hypothetical protein
MVRPIYVSVRQSSLLSRLVAKGKAGEFAVTPAGGLASLKRRCLYRRAALQLRAHTMPGMHMQLPLSVLPRTLCSRVRTRVR